MQWLPQVGVFLMGMTILGFLAVSALFVPPFWAWFIYLFLLPFFVWLPGMTLHPAVGWAIAGAWLIAFPVLRWWLWSTPTGGQWRELGRGEVVACVDAGVAELVVPAGEPAALGYENRRIIV